MSSSAGEIPVAGRQSSQVVFLTRGLQVIVPSGLLRFLDVRDHARLAACSRDTSALVEAFREKNPILKPKNPNQPRVIGSYPADSYESSPLLRDWCEIDLPLLMRYAGKQEGYACTRGPFENSAVFLRTILPHCQQLKRFSVDSCHIRGLKLPGSVEDLTIFMCYEIDEEEFLDLLKRCPGLRHLRLDIPRSRLPPAVILRALADLPQLETFEIENEIISMSPIITFFCEHRPKLRRLVVGSGPIEGNGAIHYSKIVKRYPHLYTADSFRGLHKKFGDALEFEWHMTSLVSNQRTRQFIPQERWRRIDVTSKR